MQIRESVGSGFGGLGFIYTFPPTLWVPSSSPLTVGFALNLRKGARHGRVSPLTGAGPFSLGLRVGMFRARGRPSTAGSPCLFVSFLLAMGLALFALNAGLFFTTLPDDHGALG